MKLIRLPVKPKRSPLLAIKLGNPEVRELEDVPGQRVLVGGFEVAAAWLEFQRVRRAVSGNASCIS